jgi:nucleotidyltransferase/DNA polymerase involved in DNA repair
VRSAMPANRAERLCPAAIFVAPDFTRCRAVSKSVREIFKRHTDLIEPLSLDECLPKCHREQDVFTHGNPCSPNHS